MDNFLASDLVQTTNTDLAAALCAVGIPLDKECPVRRMEGQGEGRLAFFFHSISPCGLYHTRELMLAWDDPSYADRNPEHPFAYLMVAFRNRARLRDYIKRSAPTVMIHKNGKIAFVSLAATARTEAIVFQELKQPGGRIG